MKTILRLSAVFLMLGGGVAQATLPKSAFSSAKMSLHAAYVSSDPTCQTGLVAILPMSKTAKEVDFANNPEIATNVTGLPSSIKCMVWVYQNTMSVAWKAGTYTTTTNQHGSVISDSGCNSGGDSTFIPNNPFSYSGPSITYTYPEKIQTDAAAVGLTLTTTISGTAAATGTETSLAFLSTYSDCIADQEDATSLANGCFASGYFPDSAIAPTAAGSKTEGIRLTEFSGTSDITMVFDPTLMIAGTSGGSCSNYSGPKLSVHN